MRVTSFIHGMLHPWGGGRFLLSARILPPSTFNSCSWPRAANLTDSSSRAAAAPGSPLAAPPGGYPGHGKPCVLPAQGNRHEAHTYFAVFAPATHHVITVPAELSFLSRSFLSGAPRISTDCCLLCRTLTPRRHQVAGCCHWLRAGELGLAMVARRWFKVRDYSLPCFLCFLLRLHVTAIPGDARGWVVGD